MADRSVAAVAPDVVEDLAPRRFVVADTFARLDMGGSGIDGSGHTFEPFDTLFDDPDRFEHLEDAHHHLVEDIAGLGSDHLPIHQTIGGMGVVAAHIDVDAGGARGGAERSERHRLLAGEHADPARPCLHQGVVHDSRAKHLDRLLETIDHFEDRGDIFAQDIAVNPARLHHAVVIPVAGDALEDVEHVLPVAPCPHPDRVESEEMAGQPKPQQVRMDTFQLAHGRPDVEGAFRHLDPAGFLDRLHAGERMGGRADAADALDQEDGFLEVLGLG